MNTTWQTSRYVLDLTQPLVMGIVNLTPDSFSDAGQCLTSSAALQRCEHMLRDGARILDIGAESTRPGATPLPLEQELARLLPVLREAVKLGVPISVDTYKPQVMQVALDLGADIINDIWALRWRAESGALSATQVLAAHPSSGISLMHMHGEPQTMQAAPLLGDAVPQVQAFLQRSAAAALDAGIARERIVLDPGIGFGKTPTQNFSLLARQAELLALGYPLLVGWSRKSSLSTLLDLPQRGADTDIQQARLVPSVVAAVLAAQRGARVLRVHDVPETVQALRLLHAIN